MKLSSSYIYLKEARFHAYHGVFPQEQTVGMVEVTLDYGALYRLIEREMAVPSQLLEHVAGRIANAVLETFPQVTSLDLTVTKLNPPIGGDCKGAGVEVHLINDKTK